MDSYVYLSLFIAEYAGYAPISAEKHILSHLWYLGHESAGYRDVADRFDITISTLYEILARVTNFLMQLAPQVIKFPTIQEKEETMAHFLRQKQFPGVIGTIYIKKYRLQNSANICRRHKKSNN